MSIEETLSSLKKKIDSINTKRIETDTKLKALEEEKQALLSECSKLGVDPSKLEEIVFTEEAKFKEETYKLESEIQVVYGQLEKF